MEKPNGERLIRQRSARKRRRAQELRKKGYSIRQIMRALKVKSPATVTYYLKSKVEKQKQ